MKKSRINFLTIGLTGVITIIVSACKLYYTPAKVEYAVSKDSRKIEEGKRLTMLMCGTCHYNSETKKLSGARMEDVPGFVGKIYSKNITNHPTKGIGTYTDAQLAYLIRTGISRDGKLMPYMQKPNLADEDLNAIILFLRSDDELVSASDVEAGKTKYTTAGKLGISKAKPLPWPAKEIGKPDKADRLATGKYLVDNLSCYDCHSKGFMSVNKMFPEESKGYMGGGNKLKNKNGSTVESSNLTAHVTGIGSWNEEDFIKALRNGISKDNSVIAYPMPNYSELTDTEITSIYAYLKTLPVINNKVKKK